MNIEGAYDTKEEMKGKVSCPFLTHTSVYNKTCDRCAVLRFGTMGRNNAQPIKKFWCGAGGKPEFEYRP